MSKSERDLFDPTPALAPLWKRVLASMINVSAVIGAVVALVAVVAAPLFVLAELDEDALDRVRARVDPWREKRRGRPKVASPGIGVGLAFAIERRNRPSYGQRVMGIHRVDAATGGPISARSATIHYIVAEFIRALVPHESDTAGVRRRERFREVTPELVELWTKPSDGHVAVLRESAALLRQREANPFGATMRTSGLRLAIHVVSITVLPKRQSLPDLAAGITTAVSDK